MSIDRGSEWRRWDFHLHTPFTNKNDQFVGRTEEEKWKRFYSDIADYMGDGSDSTKTVSAIGITDYVSIDNYIKVRDDNMLPRCVEFVFPNVELRMTPVSKKEPTNIHCIFNPAIVDRLDELFFSKLEMDYKGDKYSATRQGLINLGRSYSGRADMPDDEAYSCGIDQFVISYKVLFDLFRERPLLKENTMIVVANGTNDGASGVRAHADYLVNNVSQLDATVRDIYQNSDMIFSSNPKDVQYFLGKGTDSPDEVIRKCGALKPCVWGSDAHINKNILMPYDGRYCWIKADLTFEGLRQVKYEPEERVHIGETRPDYKDDYAVIDKVEITNNPFFSPEPIYFSENLTCIIGGKSTGKSLLLHNMAKAVDSDQVEKRCEVAHTNVMDVMDVYVHWRNGTCSANGDSEGKIVYIPQGYLIKLSDDEDGEDDIDEIVEGIILQNKECAELKVEFDGKILNEKREVGKCILEYLSAIAERGKATASCREIGNEDEIKSEIKKQKDILLGMRKVGITDEDVERYQDAIARKQTFEKRRDDIEKEIGIIEKAEIGLSPHDFGSEGVSIYLDDVSKAIEETEKSASDAWYKRRDEILRKAHADLDETDNSIKDEDTVIESLKPGMENNEAMKACSESIAEQEKRLNNLREAEDRLRKIENNIGTHLSVLVDSVGVFAGIYDEYVRGINEKYRQYSGDIEISVGKVFLGKKLTGKIADVFDNRTFARFEGVDLNNVTEEDMSPENVGRLIEAVLANSEGSLRLKKGYVAENALREIIGDWYKIDYRVKMGNDDMHTMSPGKKALVFLKFFICMSDSRYPILIDQPEDDLDNRSIYDELIGFIREKKKERQIIVVTHNANIVVGADAELVIVANQEGKNTTNERYRIEYRGGAIENNEAVPGKKGILNSKGIRDHICEILEGGERAFSMRQHKYGLDGR